MQNSVIIAGQNSLIAAGFIVILLCLLCFFLLYDDKEYFTNKYYFISSYSFALVAFFALFWMPKLTHWYEFYLLELVFGFHTILLTIGLALRSQRKILLKITYAASAVHIAFLSFNLHSFLSFSAMYFAATMAVLGVVAIICRKPAANIPDYALAVVLSLFAAILFILGTELSHETTKGDFYYQKAAHGLVIMPAFFSSFTILLMASFMRDVNKKLQYVAMYDALTRLFNRWALYSHIDVQVARLRRNDAKACIVMADIDHFKKINDQFGHSVGDEAIKHFAAVLKTTYRESDIIARYGGEEFLIFLPDTDLTQAQIVTNRAREMLEKSGLKILNEHVTITASFGICDYDFNVNTDASISGADKALYEAKNSGRNRVVIAYQ